MKKLLTVAAGLAITCLVVAFPRVSSAASDSINIGVGGAVAPDTSASAFFGEYEHALGNKVSVLGRVGGVNYSYDDGTYAEDGDVKGADIGVRIYPGGGMKGFFFGAGAGIWTSDWTFIDDKGTFYETRGKGTSDAVRLDLEVGGRFPLGSGPVSLMPSFHLVNFFSTGNTCTFTKGATGSCSNETDLGVYTLVSVSAGFAF